MKEEIKPPAEESILVEFIKPADDEQKLELPQWQTSSKNALKQAVHVVRQIATEVTEVLDGLPEEKQPSQIEVYFGIKLHSEAGAILASSPDGASLAVRLNWYPKEKPVVTFRPVAGLIPPVKPRDDDKEKNHDHDDDDED